MLWLMSLVVAYWLGGAFGVHICAGELFPQWRARRLREKRAAGYSAFLFSYGSLLWDPGGFSEYLHRRGMGAPGRVSLVSAVFFTLILLFLWMVFAILAAFGTK
ncbi:hypothetical protein [Paracoccus denitrificans]|jgi:hypothetical protein|uniref:Uncharacterized protein n=1 Tax=Paracoccus denitrificans (strain Pd 1222) TaxID=318586 RepID=A1BA16_PARDP|nr:hypothetical protein [Paracoccus denitrificans]ABL72360.1 hypothetical protein Pden_4296 [Paracoccus denitrificans PD1222]MBB4628491.1 hypothetical protein [Paracoccus denitrificans]MCU7430207.1 hypothetical protein [Paracoccus denitrificans]QAR28923.1 hypothetical protein EO213_21865 [Paracoccus denitrificans]UPV97076.1 hypothetical protein M0K93_21970 [Paracoccus denitrificans]